MLPFILLNIIVSAVVVTVVLAVRDRRGVPQTVVATPIAAEEVSEPDEVVVNPQVDPLQPTSTISADSEEASPPTDPTPIPEPTQTFHTVASGELLGSISVRYGVLVEDIVAANGLTDPNQIFVGQQLLIPIGGVVAESEPEAPPATETPIPTVAVESGEFAVQISAVIGVGDISAESVTISNAGANPVDLAGWTLADESGQLYTFQQNTLYGGGAAITIFTGQGQDDAASLYWGLDTAIWQTGEIVTLRDGGGNIQATFTIP